ncbi:MAG: cell division protein, partial [Leptospiraceae bacterium]|nr:cell division protein [Leptospiraceae bacterium]
RIKDARLVQRSGTRLLLSIIERDARFIVNTGDNLYEIDEDFNIISSNFVVDTSVIILSGDFSFNPKNNKDTKFRDFAETVWENFGQFPVLMDRISEVVLGSDGEISIFIYRPMRMKVLMGDTLNRKQVRKLYSSLAYFEKKKNKVGLLDLRGDDAVYY